ncbi:sensor histidine kinase [Microtetraspora malaysiensis]|uniref:sensor histidine kinase n=1 Tax=Microtetraspora malaysiensis TaxID=161358 RepID=UPI003D8EF68C
MRSFVAGTEPGPRLARLTVAVVFAGFASVYVLAADGVAEALLPLGVLVLQLGQVFPRWRRLRGPAALAAQAVLATVAVLVCGVSVGLFGFLAGSLLLVSAWPAAVLVVAGAALVQATRSADALAVIDSTIAPALAALVIYGLTRMAERVDEVAAARVRLALAAVAEERLRIATELNEGIGRGLDAIERGARRAMESPVDAGATGPTIGDVAATARRCLADARSAAADYRALSLAPEVAAARALLSAAGVETEVRIGHTEPLGSAGALLATVLRDAVTDVVRQGTARHCLIETVHRDGMVRLRVTNDGVRTAGAGVEGLDDVIDRMAAVSGALRIGLDPDGRFGVEAAIPATPPAPPPPDTAYGLSIALLGTVVAGFCVKALLLVPGDLVLPAAACLVVIAYLQLRSVRGRHPYALAAMALLAYAPLFVFGQDWLGVGGFLAGPLLLMFRWAVSLPLVAVVMASVATAAAAFGLPAGAVVNYTASTLVTGLVIHGLVGLARVVKELQDSREEPARAAIVQERLRAARDLHDLLGHNLAAILLKCELARRLADAAPERARAEIADVIVMAGRARADLRAASGDHREMSLEEEAESARSVLAAAGMEVRLSLGHGPLPAPAETVLATVLREAVTNVLRHSSARSCHIASEVSQGVVRLSVRNDGVRPDAGRGRPGSGIGNLTARLAALGGELTARVEDDGWFRVRAVLAP